MSEKGAGRGSGGYGGWLVGGLKEMAATASAQAAVAGATVTRGVQERLETAQGGKKMLDEGGPAVEAQLLAKKTAKDAVTLDRSIVAKLSDAAQIYSEAAQKMKASSVASAGTAATNEVSDFDRLARDYEARAAALKVALETLGVVPEAPEITPVEQDAIAILVVKGEYKWAAAKTAEGFNTLRRKSGEAAASASGMGGCPA